MVRYHPQVGVLEEICALQKKTVSLGLRSTKIVTFGAHEFDLPVSDAYN